MTTVSKYVKQHPRSILAKRLKRAFGKNSRKQIIVSSGIIAPYTKSSKLYKALKRKINSHYIVGGCAGINRNDGKWFAVYTIDYRS